MKKILLAVGCAAALGASAAVTVDAVNIRQLWPWSGDVAVDFTVSGLAAGEECALRARAFDGDTPLGDVSDALVEGCFAAAANGRHRAVIRPSRLSALKTLGTVGRFRLTLDVADSGAASEKLYKIIDLEKEAGAPGQVTYVTARALAAGSWGTFETKPEWIGQSVLDNLGGSTLFWTGLTNNPAYLTTKLVLRRIKATCNGQPYTIGASSSTKNPLHTVRFAADYWMGVYETTVGHYARLDRVENLAGNNELLPARGGGGGSLFARITSYDGLRGKAGESPDSADYNASYDWPEGRDVAANSFMGRARAHTGIQFDLPTHAQWAAAANGGAVNCQLYTAAAVNDANVKLIAFCNANSGNTVQRPGQLLPNAFGLYDVLGNVRESLRDWAPSVKQCESGAALDEAAGTADGVARADAWVTVKAPTGVACRALIGGAFSMSPTGGQTLNGLSGEGDSMVLPNQNKKGDTGFRLYAPLSAGE